MDEHTGLEVQYLTIGLLLSEDGVCEGILPRVQDAGRMHE
jgi:hypothetical protein